MFSFKHRFSALVILAILSLTLAACGGETAATPTSVAATATTQAKPPTATAVTMVEPTNTTRAAKATATTADSTTNTGSSDNAELLNSAVANMKAAESYTLIVKSAGGTAISFNADLHFPSRSGFITLSSGSQNAEVLIDGDDAYITTDGGKTYQKGSASDLNLDNFVNLWDKFESSKISAAGDLLKDGSPATEKIEGAETRHITGSSKELGDVLGSGSSSSTGTVEFWLTTDSKPTVRQMRVAGTSSGTTTDVTVNWVKVNELDPIEVPASVKEAATSTDMATPSDGMATPGTDMATPGDDMMTGTETTTPEDGMMMGGTPTAESSDGGTGVIGSTGSDGTIKVANLDSIKSYHLVLDQKTISGGTTTTSKIEGDFVRPDKARMSIDSNGTKVEYTVIGDNMYMNVGGQSVNTTGGKAMVGAYDSLLTSTAASVGTFNGYKSVGSESIGGEDCDHYTYDYDASGTTGKYDVWIAKSDKTARQVVYNTKTGTLQSDLSYTITKVNQIGDITAP